MEYLGVCLREHRNVIGASSLAYDPARPQYPAWATLPYINQGNFAAELGRIIRDMKICNIYSSHPVVWDYLSRTLQHIAPGVVLVNASPANEELEGYRAAHRKAKALLGTALPLNVPHKPRPDMSVLEAAVFYYHAEAIPGMCDHEKLRALYEIARYCPAGDIVEIGSWWGKSAFIFLRLAQTFGIGKLLCVDPWSDAHLVQNDNSGLVDAVSAQFSAQEALEVFEINLLPYDRGDVNYLRMPSTEGAAHYRRQAQVQTIAFGKTTYEGRIALLHVDGNHTYENAKADVAAWSELVMHGGWIVIDDYTWPFGDGPQRVGNEYLAANQPHISTAFVMGGALFIRLND
jgi:cephalosporin hydroxylase